MKKFLMMLAVVSMVFAFTGCKEKSTSEKFGDSLKKMSDQAEDAAKDAQKDASKALDDAKKSME
ncbi:MAG: hypothetical protein WCT05_15335 [Lentisphaeria bacterium]